MPEKPPSSITITTDQRRHDILGGLPLPNCPYLSSSLPPTEPGSNYGTPALHSPTVSLTFLTIGVTCITFGIIAAAKYDSARVFNRTIRDRSVRNGWWAAYFLVLGVSFVIDFIRYALDLPHMSRKPDRGSGKEATVEPQVIDAWLLFISAVLRSFSVFSFTLALNYQRKNRSSSITQDRSEHPTSSRNPAAGNHPSSSASSSRPASFPAYGAVSSQSLSPTRSPSGSRPGSFISRDRSPNANAAKARRARDSSNENIRDEEEALLEGYETPDGFDDDEPTSRSARCGSGSRCCGLAGCLRRVFASWGFLALILWLMNLLSIYLATNPPSMPPGHTLPNEIPVSFPPPLVDPGPHTYSPTFFRFSVAMDVIQHIPVLILATMIIAGPYEHEEGFVGLGRRTNRRRQGPAGSSKFLLFLGLLLGSVWLVKPSVLSRGVDALIRNTDSRSNLSYHGRMCVVPPWWWLEAHEDPTYMDGTNGETAPPILGTALPKPPGELHGWASWVDLLQWTGYTGLWLIFGFVRKEYKRNKEVAWVYSFFLK
ncbi:hypothetical protein SpCBS45565_g04795 [Spizellomyces sp. 'palustris']|nr:hypothetical protein SpCBS45565_g04795 [Spizellomyces sp. 'palustris']